MPEHVDAHVGQPPQRRVSGLVDHGQQRRDRLPGAAGDLVRLVPAAGRRAARRTRRRSETRRRAAGSRTACCCPCSSRWSVMAGRTISPDSVLTDTADAAAMYGSSHAAMRVWAVEKMSDRVRVSSFQNPTNAVSACWASSPPTPSAAASSANTAWTSPPSLSSPSWSGHPPGDVAHRSSRRRRGVEDRPQQLHALGRPVVRVGHALDRGCVEQRRRSLLGPRHRPGRLQRRPRHPGHPVAEVVRELTEGVEHEHLAEAAAMLDGVEVQVGLDRRQDRSGPPVESTGGDRGRLPATSRPDDSNRRPVPDPTPHALPAGHLRPGGAVLGGDEVATDPTQDEPAPRRPLHDDRRQVPVTCEPCRGFDPQPLRPLRPELRRPERTNRQRSRGRSLPRERAPWPASTTTARAAATGRRRATQQPDRPSSPGARTPARSASPSDTGKGPPRRHQARQLRTGPHTACQPADTDDDVGEPLVPAAAWGSTRGRHPANPASSRSSRLSIRRRCARLRRRRNRSCSRRSSSAWARAETSNRRDSHTTCASSPDTIPRSTAVVSVVGQQLGRRQLLLDRLVRRRGSPSENSTVSTSVCLISRLRRAMTSSIMRRRIVRSGYGTSGRRA